MITLRPYQQKLIDETRLRFKSGIKSALLVAPCGSGKTVCFSYFCKEVSSRNKKTLIIAHREELLDQISETLKKFAVPHGFIAAGREENLSHLTQVASVFSLVKRLHKISEPDLIIVDESHHVSLKTTWGKVLAKFPNAWKIGVTASPCRLSGEPLGDVFQEIVLGPTVTDLINSGSLCKYKLFAPPTIDTSKIKTLAGEFNLQQLDEAMNKPVITGDAIREYMKRANGKRAVVFCTSVNHSREVARAFNDQKISAYSLDGKMDRGLRASVVSGFRSGQIKIITNCGIISEGFDLPAIEVAIVLRPTQSLALWIQMSGRALRPFPGKEYALIMDHGGNTARLGLPCEDREWSLKGRLKRKSTDLKIRICPQCYAAMNLFNRVCPECGYAPEIADRAPIEIVEGDLHEVDIEARKRMRFREQSGAKTLEDLILLGKQRKYRNAVVWAKHVFAARLAKQKSRP